MRLERSNAPWLPDQNLEVKLGFIKDLEHGLVQREADDIGDDVVSYATIKAMSSGNPLMLKKVELDSKMHRLEALRREWLRARTGMAREKGYIEKRIPRPKPPSAFWKPTSPSASRPARNSR